MTQQHGRRYEHSLAHSLNENTWDDVWVTTCGWSGNSAIDGCDIVVTVSPKLATSHEKLQYNIEAKKRQGDSGKRTIVFSGSAGKETGVQEVERLIKGTPDWGQPLIALKWDHRQLYVCDGRSLLAFCEGYENESLDEQEQTIIQAKEATSDNLQALQNMEPRITPSGSISLVKPDCDRWPSATSGVKDGVYLAEEMDIV